MRAMMESEKMSRISKYLKRYDGKDKLARSIQYSLKGMAYYLLLNPRTILLGKRLNKSYKQISIGRKSFRLFRWILNARAAYLLFLAEKDPLDRTLGVVANLSMAIWAVLDHYIWAFSIGLTIVPNHRKLFVRTRQRQFRVLTACCLLVIAVRKLRRYVRDATLKKGRGCDEIRLSHPGMLDKSLAALKPLLDVFSYAKGAGAEWLVLNVDCHNGVSGMAGLAASLIKVRSIWNKC